MPTDNVVQFLPRANPKADRAYWIKEAEREAAQLAGAVEIQQVSVVADSAPAELSPDKDLA